MGPLLAEICIPFQASRDGSTGLNGYDMTTATGKGRSLLTIDATVPPTVHQCSVLQCDVFVIGTESAKN